MKSVFFLMAFFLLLGTVSSCKRSCYACAQYCAYCQLRSDSAIIYKVCTSKYADQAAILAIMNDSFPATRYNCALLNNTQEVCDGQDKIAQSITYYEKEDYFCTPN